MQNLKLLKEIRSEINVEMNLNTFEKFNNLKTLSCCNILGYYIQLFWKLTAKQEKIEFIFNFLNKKNKLN